MKRMVLLFLCAALLAGCATPLQGAEEAPAQHTRPTPQRLYIREAGMMDSIFDDLPHDFTGATLSAVELGDLCSALRGTAFEDLKTQLAARGLQLAWEMHPADSRDTHSETINESYLEHIGQSGFAALRLNWSDGIDNICISLLFTENEDIYTPYYAVIDLPYRGEPGRFLEIGPHAYYVCRSSGVSGTGHRKYYTGYHNLTARQTELTFVDDYYSEHIETDHSFTTWQLAAGPPQLTLGQDGAFSITVPATATMSAIYYDDGWVDPGFPDDVFEAKQLYVFHYDPAALAFYYEGSASTYLLDLAETKLQWHIWNNLFRAEIDSIPPGAHPYRQAFAAYHRQEDSRLHDKQLRERAQGWKPPPWDAIDPYTGRRILPNIAPDAAIPQIDTASEELLKLHEELLVSTHATDESMLTSSIELGGHIITNQYRPQLGRFIITLDGDVVAGYNWPCYIRCGLYDVTNDGKEEAVFFICPEMSNTEFGTVSIFAFTEEGAEEILQFCGDPHMELPRFPEEYEVTLPNAFDTGSDPQGGYARLCMGVRIMREGDTTFLQLVHSNNSTERASSYILWQDGWKVIRQEVIPVD